MIIIPIQDISDKEATVNVPMWVVAAIFKKWPPCYTIVEYLINYGADCGNSSAIVYVFEVKD